MFTQGDLFQTLKETWVPLRREWDTLKRGRGSAGDRAGHAGTWFVDPSLCLLALLLVLVISGSIGFMGKVGREIKSKS